MYYDRHHVFEVFPLIYYIMYVINYLFKHRCFYLLFVISGMLGKICTTHLG